MKTSIITIGIFTVCAVQAQTNWTFQWHGQERGLIFEQTNLTKSVKAAIRDDIAQVMSKVVASDITVYPIQPDDPDFGKIDGLMDFVSKVHACPNNFPLGDYRTINGTPFFLLSEEECSVYASAVALTKQYASAIGSLSNFLASAEAMTPANTTTNAFVQKFWHLNKNRVAKITDASEMNFAEIIQIWGGGVHHIYPSILQFGYGPLEEGPACLHAEIKTFKKADPMDCSSVHVVYKSGKWRFLVWDW